MAAPYYSRPLPTPPTMDFRSDLANSRYELYPHPSNFPYDYPQYQYNEPRPAGFPAGTLLHKGFYDLLSMIPTPSPSRMFQQWKPDSSNSLIAGARYEELGKDPVKSVSPPSSPVNRKGRRISKDMVSHPTGFVHLVHASDADQAEELLTRWGPDGLGKLGDPRWANPIKNKIRQGNQLKYNSPAVNVPQQSYRESIGPIDAGALGPLRVVNGMSTTTVTSSSMLTTVARENFSTQPNTAVDGLPGRPGNSTIRWGGIPGLITHPEVQEHDEREGHLDEPGKASPELPSPPRKPIVPSLATLEKAVSARIYFENLYFPLFKHPPSREQRRLAMERDMMEMNLSHTQKENLRQRWRQNETEYLRERRQKVDVTAFAKLKTIGHGAFGVVSLVREQSTGQLFAMKQLRKTDMLRKGQEGHVRAERDLLKSASLVSSPGGAEWIVKLHYSFQDRENLYLVLEYMGGGDLLNLLIERDVFEEDFTRFYVAEMILAIESCHKHGFIHRDIKPDNFLFDPNGHIKLSDFGLATDLHWAHDTSYYEQQRLHLLHKHGIDLEDTNGIADGKKTKRMDRREVERLMGGDGPEGVFTWREKNRRKVGVNVCGTNSYMSPEVIRGHGYSYSCDWWSLGVIMFECLYGYPPFVNKSRHVTRQMILNWKQYLRFPKRLPNTKEPVNLSSEAIDLMQQLLCEPEDRLGSQASSSVSRPNSLIMQSRLSGFVLPQDSAADGAHLIKAHPWFRGIDWANIHRYEAPYRPELQNPEDTRHFDDDIPAEPLAPANGAPPDATRDPMLRDRVHGAEILDVRKALAFAGFTHKSPRAFSYVRADRAFDHRSNDVDVDPQATVRARGRSVLRDPQDVGRSRAISM
ncbi:kinase-like domain-containing protein [Lentinula guzmanii]|uniref:non-specific serine/threonine protein kinase n=1 Tax=Lentinula guzmanii TaxID=2804957 RepID=A0AA38JVA1_9AGAR|nr:kinase-like domain-containing protein [Lentinula guzmanii]